MSTRIGKIHNTNIALIIELISGTETENREYITTIRDKRKRFSLIAFGAYFVISRVISFQRNQGLMLDLTMIGEEAKSQKNRMTIALKGKVKRGRGSIERDYLFPCARVAASGLDFGL